MNNACLDIPRTTATTIRLCNKKGGFGEPAKMEDTSGKWHYAVQGKKWILHGKEFNAGFDDKLKDGKKIRDGSS